MTTAIPEDNTEDRRLVTRAMNILEMSVEELSERINYKSLPRIFQQRKFFLTDSNRQHLEDVMTIEQQKLTTKNAFKARQTQSQGTLREEEASYFPAAKKARMIPVLSFVQAGLVAEYELLPDDWQQQIATDCPNPKAFALEVRGDSMEPKFIQGTIITLMPEEEPSDGCLVVAKLNNGDAAFKIFHAQADEITLTSYNPAFPPKSRSREEFDWIWPVYESRIYQG